MATAKSVKDFEPINLEWLLIEDDAGHVRRYQRAGESDLAEAPQVEGHLKQGHPLRATLVRDHNGHALLRQDGPDLPRTLIVQYIEDPNDLYRTALGLPGKGEYVLVA